MEQMKNVIVTVKALHKTQKTATLKKCVDEHNIKSILEDIDKFIWDNKQMYLCGILIQGDGYDMCTTVRICKKFDIFDLYSFIENQIYHYIY